MNDHPVKQKLEQTILPYFVSAEKLKWRPLYVAHGFYVYVHDILAALVGLGISHPLLELVASTEGPEAGADLMNTVGSGPAWLAPVTIVAAVLWVLLKVTVTRGDGAKRSALARSARKEFRRLEANLQKELSAPDPMLKLNEIAEAIQGTVDRNIAEDSWPWPGIADGTGPKVKRKLAELCARFEANWNPVPDVAQQVA